MKKTILVLLMVLLSVMLVVSCKKEPEKEAEIKYDDLIGYWQQGEGSDYIRIKFNEDETVRLDEKSASYTVSCSITMTSTLKDNVITLIHTDGDKSVEYRYKLSFEGEHLILVQESETSMCFMHTEEIRLIMDKKNLG